MIPFSVDTSGALRMVFRAFLKSLFGLFVLFCTMQLGAQETTHRMVFWNVENYFDTRNDSVVNDDTFTPKGMNRWSRKRFEQKRNNIFKTLMAVASYDRAADTIPLSSLMPLLVGLCEVENAYVLDELCRATPLRQFDYDYLHFDSPDRRGVDCALLYRKALFSPFLVQPLFVSDTASLSDDRFTTRDILLVGGRLPGGDSLFVFVNHWPSKLAGAASAKRRMRVAAMLRSAMEDLCLRFPSATMVVMGDFNAEPSDLPVSQGLGFGNDSVNGLDFVNLTACRQFGMSYKYRDQWSAIDQLMVRIPDASHAVVGPFGVARIGFLLVDDERYMGVKPHRTFSGYRYLGGFSDHLPVYVDIVLPSVD